MTTMDTTAATVILVSFLLAASVGLFALGGAIQWNPLSQTHAVAFASAINVAR